MNEESIFAAAIEKQSPVERDRFVQQVCHGNAALQARLAGMLKAYDQPDSFLDAPETGAEQPGLVPALAQTEFTANVRIGSLIGPYKLLEQIGEGGMGLVYMAEQQQPMRRLVALKLVKPGMDSKQVIARFEAERQALAMMDHPNIAKVHDAGTTETGRPYFVMELVRGIPVNEFCDQQKLTVRQRLELFIQVCQSVQHAHQKGIIHRDLKPTNVLVTKADTVPLPKVIDFGIAKALGASLTDHTLHTGFAQLVGTPMYMSPEQAEMNHFGVDTRSDVYSLGVLLYELLSGTTPFDKETLSKAGLDEMRRMIREDEPLRPSHRISTLSAQASSTISQQRGLDERHLGHVLRGELDWIVMKALEKDRSRRYESASSLAADIQRYLSDEPVLACPPTTMYRFQKFARKHKPALATVAAIALCLLLGTTVSAWQAVRATTAEAQANANEQKAAANEQKANANAVQAQASAQQAKEKAQEANTQRDEAQRQRDEVKALADRLQRTLYASHMNLAQSAWDADRIGRLVGLLEQHRPKSGASDLRGFEWHYLYKLCHPELLKFQGNSVAYSPDGKRLAIGTNDSVRILDAQSSRELLSLKGRVRRVDFSPDSKHLAAALTDVEGTIKVWDVQTGGELHAFQGDDKGVWQVAYSPDGKRLASVGNVKGVIVRDSETGQEIFSIKGLVGGVAFSPDGKRLAGSGSEGVKVWDSQSGEELLTLKGAHRGAAFSPDGKRLASACWDETAQAYVPKLFDAQSGEELLTCKVHKERVTSLAFSPDGKRLVGESDKTIKVWDAQTGNELLSFACLTGVAGKRNLALNPEGTRLAAASQDGTVRVYDIATKQRGPTFSGASVVRMVFSPDGQRVAGVTSDPTTKARTIKVWEAQTGQEILSLKSTRANRPLAVTISPDGKRLATGVGIWDDTKNQYVSGEVKVWDAQTGRELRTFKGHTMSVVGLAFSPDSSRVVSCASEVDQWGNVQGTRSEVKVWDAASGEELLALEGHKGRVFSVAYSPDGKRLATLSRDNRLQVWDARTGRELLSLPVRSTAHPGGLAFSPDGKRLASSNSPGQVKLFSAETGEELLTLRGHSYNVGSIAFSPDGRRLVSAEPSFSNGELKLWDAQTGEELLTFEPHNLVSGAISFSPDGHRLASAGVEGLKIYDATPPPEKP